MTAQRLALQAVAQLFAEMAQTSNPQSDFFSGADPAALRQDFLKVLKVKCHSLFVVLFATTKLFCMILLSQAFSSKSNVKQVKNRADRENNKRKGRTRLTLKPKLVFVGAYVELMK